IRQLAHKTDRGFVFVRPDGTERFCPFSELCDQAQRRAAQMHAQGLVKGARLAIVVPDPDEFILSFLGAIMGGIVPVPIYPQLSFKNIESYHDTVAHIVKASGASHLLTTPTTRQYVDPVGPRVETLKEIFGVDELGKKDH